MNAWVVEIPMPDVPAVPVQELLSALSFLDPGVVVGDGQPRLRLRVLAPSEEEARSYAEHRMWMHLDTRPLAGPRYVDVVDPRTPEDGDARPVPSS